MGEADGDRARQKADVFGQIDKIIREMTKVIRLIGRCGWLKGCRVGGREAVF